MVFSDREDVRGLRGRLLRWYARRRRDLPWRRTRDPYRIWLSEVMLQQTRVNAVLGYYQRFLRRFPTVETLARARQSSVLAAWSGLGYYRRARALHAAARRITCQLHGRWPRSVQAWEQLPGVGRYTAAAVASIAFGQPVAVVDGNVARVLRRLSGRFELDGEGLWSAAGRLLSPRCPGDFNQAMMELGATVCLPAQPLCSACPMARWCATRGSGPPPVNGARRKQEVAYALALRNGEVYLRRRSPRLRLMPAMWELPPCPAPAAPHVSLRHSITDTDYRVHVARVGSPPAGGRWVPLRRLSRLPLTGLTKKILARAGVIE